MKLSSVTNKDHMYIGISISFICEGQYRYFHFQLCGVKLENFLYYENTEQPDQK